MANAKINFLNLGSSLVESGASLLGGGKQNMESFYGNIKTYNLQDQKMILSAQPSLQLSTGLCTATIPPDIDTTLMADRIIVAYIVRVYNLKYKD